MAEEKDIMVYQTPRGGNVKLSTKIVQLYLAKGTFPPTVPEVFTFMKICEAYRLDPFLGEVYLIRYSEHQPATIVVGKDTYNKRAEAHPQYDGIEAGIIIQKAAVNELEYRQGTMLLKGETLVGGWATVYRRDWTHTAKITVSFDEYEGRKKDGTPNKQWATKPATMICKVAKVQAWREAFPDILGTLLDEAEAGLDDINLPENVPPPKYEVDPQSQAGEESQAKSEEYLEIEAHILRDIAHEAFKGKVMYEGKEADLTKYRAKMPDNLAKNTISIEKLQEKADTIALLLQASLDKVFPRNGEGHEKFTPPETDASEDMSKRKDQGSFDGFDDPAETEGDLSNGGE